MAEDGFAAPGRCADGLAAPGLQAQVIARLAVEHGQAAGTDIGLAANARLCQQENG